VTIDLQIGAATDIGGRFRSIESLIGGNGSDTLIGGAGANTWSITLPNRGTVTYPGSPSLPPPPLVSAAVPFASIENLTGGGGNDLFVFADGAEVDGSIDGGGGSNALDYYAYRTPVTVDLSVEIATGVGVRIARLQTMVGGSTGDTLIGPNASTVWSITSDNAGVVTGSLTFTFSSVENLTGVGFRDHFSFADGAKIAGRVDGGLGRDLLDYSAWTRPVLVDLALGQAFNVGGVSGIEDVTGGSANDLISGDAMDNVLRGGGGHDALFGSDGDDALLAGGSIGSSAAAASTT
jgi:Ca2+-binding RTX toxin-like protein